MNRRFRPFYVAAAAVVLVGVLGIEVIPKSQGVAEPERSPVQFSAAPDDQSEWLGPQVGTSAGLLNLTNLRLTLPLDFVH
ncbi:MAG: hypothetical protein ACJ746_02205 [Bryobacteraceae bacterium]